MTWFSSKVFSLYHIRRVPVFSYVIKTIGTKGARINNFISYLYESTTSHDMALKLSAVKEKKQFSEIVVALNLME